MSNIQLRNLKDLWLTFITIQLQTQRGMIRWSWLRNTNLYLVHIQHPFCIHYCSINLTAYASIWLGIVSSYCFEFFHTSFSHKLIRVFNFHHLNWIPLILSPPINTILKLPIQINGSYVLTNFCFKASNNCNLSWIVCNP